MSAGPYTIYHFVVDSMGYRGDWSSRPVQILGSQELSDLTIAYSSMDAAAWGAVYLIGSVPRVAIQHNAMYCGLEYGWKGDNGGAGAAIAAQWVPNAWSANALFGCTGGYPAGTTYSASYQAAKLLEGARLGTTLDRVIVPR